MYPALLGNRCGADSNSAIVIDPKGDIYKCWSDIGIKGYVISNLVDKNKNDLKELTKYLLYDPTQDSECAKCKIIPICMGGCPKRRESEIIDRCSRYKYNLRDHIEQIVLDKLKEEIIVSN
ncbi:SPASM domain-containing protein [Alkalicella caledoniensis]|uniref:SPASM domain-containing protein n=1 Tax=Alkalicella caledoniensis TaxID=2731377 RepID=A0A7G9W591_ALKCA|nr:SPASM domain-containing protein [Alkalicella caledoniensis]QNO13853.1 SPASM domain-containing protein [Alkalicella caledoniensis]